MARESLSLAAIVEAAIDGEPPRWSDADRAAIETELREQADNAREYWSQLDPDVAKTVAYLAARLEPSDGGAVEVLAALERLAVGDLILAAACAAGDDRALAEFERAFAAEIKRATQRLDSTGDLGDEVLQVMREKLFVGAPGEPRGIERYRGRGPLGRWLWVMATREALMYRRRRRRETPLVEGHIQIAEGDLELDYLKREYRAAFRVAFAEAIGDLESKQRNLLHYHYVRKLSMEQIAGIYRVHRATVFRWLRRARAALAAATREHLATRLEVGTDELDSIMRLVGSRLEASVERVLQPG